MKKFVSLLLALVTCLSLAAPAFAAGDMTDEYVREEEVEASYWDPGFAETYFDGAGNMYTGYVFPTLTAAKAQFGGDWTYTQCDTSYGGHKFNCYYTFDDDGTRCYFRVKDFWK